MRSGLHGRPCPKRRVKKYESDAASPEAGMLRLIPVLRNGALDHAMPIFIASLVPSQKMPAAKSCAVPVPHGTRGSCGPA